MEAILLINAVEKEKTVQKLLEHPGITSAYPVLGSFDIVAFTKVENPYNLEMLLRHQIKGIAFTTMLIPDVDNYKAYLFKQDLAEMEV